MWHLSEALSPVSVHFTALPLLVMHSPVDGHLGSLQSLVLRMFEHKALCGHVVYFLLGKYLGIELQGHRICLCLEFYIRGECGRRLRF